MTSGTIARFSRTLALLALLFASAAQAWGVEELMAGLAAQGARENAFVEHKRIAVLETELTVRGRLSFSPPDRLVKQITSPQQERFEIDGRRIVLLRPGEPPRQVDLGEHPALEAFIASLRASLGGDLATLRGYYTLALSGDRARWTLELTPRPGPLADFVRRASLRGSGAELRRIEFEELSGDRTVTELAPAP